jgi:monovalent cation:H+ antiporter-2, CPA2 family
LMTSPFLINAAPGLLKYFSSDPGRRNDRRSQDRGGDKSLSLNNHVILCGYGRIGRNLGMVLESHRLPFVVIELNSTILEDLEQRNIAYIYGDSVNRLVLLKANLRQAATLVITVPDPVAAVTITSIARHYNPDVKIIARAHRFEDIEVFRAAGVNAVVQPEFEASIEATRLTLLSLNRTDPEIQQALTGIRTRRYSIFQPDFAEADLQQLLGMWHDDQLGAWYKMNNSNLHGKSIKALDIRGLTGATVVSVKHGADTTVHPPPSQELCLNDELYVVGDGPQLKHFEQRFALARFCPLSKITSDAISSTKTDA